jgi:flagellar protein FliO/FliZ
MMVKNMKKIVWTVLCNVFLVVILFPLFVEAAPYNAKECIEQGAECPDLNQNETDSEQVDAGSPSLFLDLVKLFLALVFVLALIYILLKFLNRRNKMFQKVRALENIGGVALGPNKSVQIVRISDKIYVIGVGENVEMLTEITNEQTKQELLSQGDVETLRPGSLLTSLLSTKNKSSQKDLNGESTDGFKHLLKKELNQLGAGRKNIIDQYKHKDDDTDE